jgi:hypothetical protein
VSIAGKKATPKPVWTTKENGKIRYAEYFLCLVIEGWIGYMTMRSSEACYIHNRFEFEIKHRII